MTWRIFAGLNRITAAGTLWAWGSNSSAELGDGTLVSKSSPIKIGALTDWVQVDSGTHSLAVKSDGTLWAWGANGHGQLGDGTQGTFSYKSSPVKIGALTDWAGATINAGLGGASFVRKADGTLWAWGYNTFGELGDGTRTFKSSPIKIGALTDWLSAVNGNELCAAVKTDGTLWTWGRNFFGGMGDGTITAKSSPVKIGVLTDWAQVAVGDGGVIALKRDGSVWTIGNNSSGQLGDGTIVSKSSPIRVGALTDWAQVDLYSSRAYAIKNDGTLWAWGDNAFGGLGDGTVAKKSSPIKIGTLTDWKQVSSTNDGVVARKVDGTVWAWGWNDYGQLGDGTVVSKSSPIKIGALTDWAVVTGGSTHIIALRGISVPPSGSEPGVLYSWGQGWVGDGTTNSYSSPLKIGVATNWKAVANGQKATSAVKTDGTLWGWGANINFWGQFGDGTTTNKSTPTQVGALSDWKQVSQGMDDVGAVKLDGTLWTWGRNQRGALGLGPVGIRVSATKVGTLTDWKQVSMGNQVCVAVKNNGTLWAWGYGFYGIPPNGGADLSSPVQVGTKTDWVSAKVSSPSSYEQAVAIDAAGTVWVWGYSNYSFPGVPSATQYDTPTQPALLVGVVWSQYIICGSNFCLAIKPNGTLWGWGFQAGAYLGQGGSTTTPIQVGTRTDWVSTTIASNGIAILKDSSGFLWSLGGNYYGAAGQGNSTDGAAYSTPTRIGALTDWGVLGDAAGAGAHFVIKR